MTRPSRISRPLRLPHRRRGQGGDSDAAMDGRFSAPCSCAAAPAATARAACAATLGKLDGEITREEALAHARLIVAVSAHPVAADLENGFGDSPETAAETIRLAAAAGLVGGSIEDASGDPRAPIYP